MSDKINDAYALYSGHSGHVYIIKCTLDIVAKFIVATFPGINYIYSIIFRSGIVAKEGWPKVATIFEVDCPKKDAYCIIKTLKRFIVDLCNCKPKKGYEGLSTLFENR